MDLKFNKLTFDKPEDNTITFVCGGIEMLKLNPNGDIHVKGKLVENDKEVVEGMNEFLNYHKTERSDK